MLARCSLPWLCSLAIAQGVPAVPEKGAAELPAKTPAAPLRFTKFPVPEAPPLDVDAATAQAIEAMLARAEGNDGEQWPYEGVYREGKERALPVGYRVGGTAIVCLGMLAAPGYQSDGRRQQALARGLAFVLATLDEPRMGDEFVGTYDVRGWGHCYALEFLLALQDREAVPASHVAAVAAKTKWLVDVLVASAIPEAGGWNYSRPKGYRDPTNRASTFMTAPILQSLFHAQARGHVVDAAVVHQALDALERARARPGGYAYGAPAQSQAEVGEDGLGMMDRTPGSAARAAVVETTLLLAGRGDLARLERAVERFFAHWDDLAVRKSQLGTHVQPYGIAPYYFLFGHLYAAQAIEMLPDGDTKGRLRQRLRAVLARSREPDGAWNDRQFDRSAGYGTAMALLALHMPSQPKPRVWQPPAEK